MARTNNTTKAVEESNAESVAILTQANNRAVNALEQQRRGLVKYYQNETKVKVKGAPAYQAHFGSVMSIIINGIMVAVPLDGRAYAIPETFAQVFNTRIRQIDKIALQQEALSDVSSNQETSPGELNLIQTV